MNGCEQLLVESLTLRVYGLLRTTAQECRQLYSSSLELSVVEELAARNRCHRYGGGSRFGRGKCGCYPRFVVVLNKANQLLLVSKIRTKVKSNTFRLVVFQAIIKLLVITEIEALLLQLPLQIPIGFGDKHEARMFLSHRVD